LSAQPSLQVPTVVASFSTTASRPKFTKARRLCRYWLSHEGRRYKRHTPGEPTYIQGDDGASNTPFPANPHFKSAKVLDDKARELIWEKVMRDGETIKAISAEFGIDIRRVAAVVRLKEVEKDWIAKVSLFYYRLSLSMLGSYMMITTYQFDKSLRQLHGYKLLLRASLTLITNTYFYPARSFLF
jgi:hypothetical protein